MSNGYGLIADVGGTNIRLELVSVITAFEPVDPTLFEETIEQESEQTP